MSVPLKDLYFGDCDGEQEAQDKKFVDIFYTGNENYAKVLNSDAFIIKGKKGTGKTILAQYTARTLSIKKNTSCEVFKLSDIHTQILKDIPNNTLQNEEFKSFLCWYFHIVIGKQILNKTNILRKFLFFFPEAKFRSFILKKYPSDVYKVSKYNTSKSLKSTLSDTFADNNNEVKLSLDSIMALSQEYEKNPYIYQVDRIRKLVEKMTVKNQTIIFLDDIDSISGMYENKSYIYFLLALIDSVKDFNSWMKSKQINCRIILLIRDDIMDTLQYYNTNMNKLESRIINLNWSKNYGQEVYCHPLIDMLLTKIKNTTPKYADMDKAAIYSILFGRLLINGKDISEYLLSYGFGRPREVIKFFNIIQEKYPNETSFQNIEIYRKIVFEYSKWFLDELKNEISLHRSPEYVKDVISLMTNFKKCSFYYDQLQIYYEKNKEDYPNINNLRDMVSFLYEFGFLGNSYLKPGKSLDKKIIYSWVYWENGSKSAHFDRKFIVHNGFRRALSLS